MSDSSLIARKLAPLRVAVCASPEYWRRRGRPARPDDLKQHNCLNYKYLLTGDAWPFRGPDGKQYVAVYAGIGGDWFLIAGDVRSDDPADIRPPADFAPDLARYTSQGGMLWIFAL